MRLLNLDNERNSKAVAGLWRYMSTLSSLPEMHRDLVSSGGELETDKVLFVLVLGKKKTRCPGDFDTVSPFIMICSLFLKGVYTSDNYYIK